MNNKTTLRLKAKSIRKQLNIEKASNILRSKLQRTEIYQKSKHIMLFYPLNEEVKTLSLLNDSNKSFYLPRVNGQDLEVCPYKEGDKLNFSYFKTQEPITEAVNLQILDLVIVPALMADKNNFRLGYGKGFYDSFLAKTNAKSVVLIPKELIIEKLPTEPHDKPVDLVITD